MPLRKSDKRGADKTPVQRARARMYRDLILDSAERIFAERGFDQATVQEMASEAGISPKTLYAWFSGKREIQDEILRVHGLAFMDAVREASRDGSAWERLEGLVRATVAYLVEHEPYRRILMHEGVTWGLDPDTGRSHERWRASVELVASTLRQGMDEGCFHEDEPELLAATVQAVLQVQLAGRIGDAVSEPDPERIANDIFLLLRRMLCCTAECGDAEVTTS